MLNSLIQYKPCVHRTVVFAVTPSVLDSRASQRCVNRFWRGFKTCPWIAILVGVLCHQSGLAAELLETRIVSSIDQAEQPIRYWVPEAASQSPAPLLVSLHSWSFDYAQDRTEWVDQAEARGWIYLQPNFRGGNRTPQACGSRLARWDILDAIDWAIQEFPVDESRIYLCGVSGGGHMTMLMSGYHPERFSAATAWVGISDLAEWHRFHSSGETPTRYAQMMQACCSGVPGSSARVDVEYYRRSPIHFLRYAAELPLEISSGVRDGKEGSVPIHQSLRAFNVLAAQHGEPQITEEEIEYLWEHLVPLHPSPLDVADPSYRRDVLFRRVAGPSRVTIFDGGHEALPAAGCDWLAKHRRPTQRPPLEPLP